MSSPLAGRRLATAVLLIARDPTSGRLPSGRTLPVVLRGCLLGELVLTGRLDADPQRARAAAVDADSDLAGDPDPILAAVAEAVRRRPDLTWQRWFTHVEADRRALTGQLLAGERWARRGGLLRMGYTDTDPQDTERLRRRVLAVGGRAQDPADPAEALAGAFALLLQPRGQRPRPDQLRVQWSPVLGAILEGHAPQVTATLSAVLEAAARAAGRRRRARRAPARR